VNQPSFWDDERQTMTGAIDLTVQSMLAYGCNYKHWVIAFSGGKDSSTVVTLLVSLLAKGLIPRPESIRVLYADTRMELTPLHVAAMGILAELQRRGIKTEIVLPIMDDRFFVYMFGRGVPPPSNTFRWCTSQIKIEPMLAALARVKQEYDGKFLMLTGVRLGESATRDSRILTSCSKDGAECGQGWFQTATPEALADTLAPILHWRVCLVWKWLETYAPELGFPTKCIADAYGGDEAEEINARTGCVGCNLASKDTALESILKSPSWSYLAPLRELRLLYAELKKPKNRLRKDGTETRKDGTLVANPQRMGPLTMEARWMGLGTILSIQRRVNAQAALEGRDTISLINEEEESRIVHLIGANTWPDGWAGTEALATEVMDEVHRGGNVQPVMRTILEEAA
jgi:DNA sulfur modification protein DndC